MTTHTAEMDYLEKQKTYYAHMMRLHDLRIGKIKAEQNLEKVMIELEKVEASTEKLKKELGV